MQCLSAHADRARASRRGQRTLSGLRNDRDLARFGPCVWNSGLRCPVRHERTGASARHSPGQRSHLLHAGAAAEAAHPAHERRPSGRLSLRGHGSSGARRTAHTTDSSLAVARTGADHPGIHPRSGCRSCLHSADAFRRRVPASEASRRSAATVWKQLHAWCHAWCQRPVWHSLGRRPCHSCGGARHAPAAAHGDGSRTPGRQPWTQHPDSRLPQPAAWWHRWRHRRRWQRLTPRAQHARCPPRAAAATAQPAASA